MKEINTFKSHVVKFQCPETEFGVDKRITKPTQRTINRLDIGFIICDL